MILCLAHRKQKAVSYNDLDGIVKETIGGSDLEGFGEKDMTQYDLKLLRVGPDGYLFSGEYPEGGMTKGGILEEGGRNATVINVFSSRLLWNFYHFNDT